MASSSSESLESEDEFLFRDVCRYALSFEFCSVNFDHCVFSIAISSASPDLSLDEYNDEDLSEIAEEKSLKCSLVNGRYKVKYNYSLCI